MRSEWHTVRAADFINFNPRLSIKKGELATKIAVSFKEKEYETWMEENDE